MNLSGNRLRMLASEIWQRGTITYDAETHVRLYLEMSVFLSVMLRAASTYFPSVHLHYAQRVYV